MSVVLRIIFSIVNLMLLFSSLVPKFTGVLKQNDRC
jgi:hypothetical protein